MSQSHAQIWTHLVFSTKSRQPFFTNSIDQNKLFLYIATICNNNGCYAKIVGGHVDHVHILCLLNKNIALSTLVREIKANSSKWIKQHLNYSKFAWQAGYSAYGVSFSAVPQVYDYILQQEKHHGTKDFKNKLLQLLVRNQIAFNEKYLWN